MGRRWCRLRSLRSRWRSVGPRARERPLPHDGLTPVRRDEARSLRSRILLQLDHELNADSLRQPVATTPSDGALGLVPFTCFNVLGPTRTQTNCFCAGSKPVSHTSSLSPERVTVSSHSPPQISSDVAVCSLPFAGAAPPVTELAVTIQVPASSFSTACSGESCAIARAGNEANSRTARDERAMAQLD